MKYLDLKLGYKCNNNCVHCVIADQREKALDLRGNTNRTTAECKTEIIKSIEKGCTSITITGGEPTIRSDFIEIVEFAKSNNLRISLQTNGRLFHKDDLSKRSAKLIDFFMIPIHSDNKGIHDEVTQRKGSFVQTMQGIQNLLKYDSNVGVKIVISKYNHQDLLKIVKLVQSSGINYINIAFPHINGNANKNFEKVVVRYKDIQTPILDVIQFAEENNFKLDFEEVLPCALGEEIPLKYFADLKILRNSGEVKQLDSDTMNWNDIRRESKKKSFICNKCVYNQFCEGYWREYVEKYGFKEFSPITKLPNEIKTILKQKLEVWKKK